MTVGELIAFNMIATQVVQPILRLSQLWQDFQQVQVSVARLGDILNVAARADAAATFSPCRRRAARSSSATSRCAIGRTRPTRCATSRCRSRPGEVIGVVGASGSGKSTLTKLIQRLYSPQAGQVMIDGVDVAQLDPGWLRRQIGVVLQENILFNRSIHENIALGDPAMPRAMVMQAARLAGADEFIAQLAAGLRHGDRGARGQSLRRPAPAHRHRPRARHQSAHPHPRRGDLGARLRERAHHPGQHARDRARPHGHHHRPSPRGGARLRPDRRHARRARSSRSAHAKSCCCAAKAASTPTVGAAIRAGEGVSMNASGYASCRAAAVPVAHRRASSRAATASSCRRRSKSSRRRRRRCRSPLMLTICARRRSRRFVWSFFGRLDVTPSRRARSRPPGESKVIEPLDPGKIAAIQVAGGQSVKAGDLLLELDPAEAAADARERARTRCNAELGEIDRRRYADRRGARRRNARKCETTGSATPPAPARRGRVAGPSKCSPDG